MPLAWSYARTSTTRQAQADRSGMERQEQALAAWLAAHPDYALQEALVDAGISAGRGKHRKQGALAKFIEGARSGSVPPGSCLVVESMSRFSREAERAALETLLRDVWGQGLAIAFAEGDGAVLTGELIDTEPYRLYGLLGGISQARAEWLERSRRSKGAAAKARNLQDEGARTGGPTPWWIARDGQGRLVRDQSGAMTLDPVAVATIRRAVELATAGMGSTLIATTLNTEGYQPPPTQSRRNQYVPQASAGWTKGRVATLLRHPALVGTLIRKGAPDLAGYYPSVLTPEEWATLRASMERRTTLRGQLRGGSRKVHSLFQTLIRCGECGGPISFHKPSPRARADHPGYMACRDGNCRKGGTCRNNGYVRADHLEAHCFTRLQQADWEALLRRPDDDQDRHQLEQDVARLTGERDQTKAQLKGAQERAQAAWIAGASEDRQATIEGAIALLRGQLKATSATLAGVEQELAFARSSPTSVEAAAELRDRVRAFWQQLATATPAERQAFNRWLLSRRPAIEFRVHPKPVEAAAARCQSKRSERPRAAVERGAGGGDRLVELFLDGHCVSYAPLAGLARVLAWEQGMVDPALVAEEPLPSGHVAALLIERPEMGSDPAAWLEKAGHLLVVNPAKPLEEATSWQLEHSYSLDLDTGDGDDGAELQGEEGDAAGGGDGDAAG